jgi:hypothetical protein
MAFRPVAIASKAAPYVSDDVLSLVVLSLHDTRDAIYRYPEIPAAIWSYRHHPPYGHRIFHGMGVPGQAIDLEISIKDGT